MKIKTLVVFATLFASTLFAQSGSELFNKNCSSCHTDVLGVNVDLQDQYTNIYKAPYIKDLIEKLKSKTENKEAFTAFIQSYINDPEKRKSLYGKKAIKKFGLMPSLKGALTEEEITILSDYLYSGYQMENKVISKKATEIIDPRAKLFEKHCSCCHEKVLGVNVDIQGRYSYISDTAPHITNLVTKLKHWDDAYN